MSEPAVFVLIRDGQPRYFGDRWASAFLFRELVWGPDELERWLTESEEMDAWSDEASGGAVVDYDNRKLVWYGDGEPLGVPRVAAAYNKLLQTSWPGFEIQFATRGLMDLAAAAGEPDAEDYDDEAPERCSTVREAAGLYDEDDEVDEDAEDPYDDDDVRAWVTLIDSEGAVRHRNLSEISEDLLRGDASAISILANLPAAELPSEGVVTEGMWIDQANREVGFWGGGPAALAMPSLRTAWEQLPDGWKVVWAERGYADQCAVSGPSGVPMTDEEALGAILPTILSTKRFDLGTMFGAVGGHLKKTAIKATGCLLMVLCAPILLFGAISGDWKSALITIAVVVTVVAIVFKVIEYRVKRKFAMPGLQSDGQDEEEDQRPPVAGPINEKERQARIDQLLKAAGFPTLAQIKPHFAEDSLEDLL